MEVKKENSRTGIGDGREGVHAAVGDFFLANVKSGLALDGYIPVTGKIIEQDDLHAMVEACLDMWLTAGRFAKQFERELAQKVGARWSRMTVSGSAANLLSFAALTSPSLGKRAVRPGDEVITVAAGFPTTVSPIVQHGCVPVFVDVDLQTHNVLVDQVSSAVTSKTRAIVLAHTLGNPFDLDSISEICRKHDLFLIEDSCDALGATYDGRPVGTFGDLSTLSFYPAHHICTGEGGAVFSSKPQFMKIVESLRDWGRDCWCDPGKDNTCKKRFEWQLGDLPEGYDHKYIYSHLGYNLKATDIQAALGLSQLQKLDRFVTSRRENHNYLDQQIKLRGLNEFFLTPEATAKSDPSWFGYLLTVRENVPLSRRELVKSLEEKGIGTRQLFAGNLIRQPAFKGVDYRVPFELKNTDHVMASSFWLGVWPGLTKLHLDRILDSLESVVRNSLDKNRSLKR